MKKYTTQFRLAVVRDFTQLNALCEHDSPVGGDLRGR